MGSQKGSAVLLFTLALGLAAVMGGVYFVYSSGSGEESTALEPQEAFDALKKRVDLAVGESVLLNASVERNSNSFACMYTAIADCQGQGGLFQIYEGVEQNAPPLSQLLRGTGLTVEGAACRGFPSPACPLRVEAVWSPVCNSGYRCEGTRSARFKFKVMLGDNPDNPQEWTREELFTPSIKLSQSVTCERGGGVWGVTECLTPDQAAERQIASRGNEGKPRFDADQSPTVPEQPEYVCPDQLEIQGEYVQLEHLGANRALARVPAMNGCLAEDIFTFQCQHKRADDREGQWVQVEAQMAPNCDANGAPLVRPDFTSQGR